MMSNMTSLTNEPPTSLQQLVTIKCCIYFFYNQGVLVFNTSTFIYC